MMLLLESYSCVLCCVIFVMRYDDLACDCLCIVTSFPLVVFVVLFCFVLSGPVFFVLVAMIRLFFITQSLAIS